ncbi:MAG: cysteine peptidase family C39 domain-containing protein [Phycisphaerales bacterium]|nr:cysteine peptidase family C39 domain-containing protein [Phycisphaerales bacterium]
MTSRRPQSGLVSTPTILQMEAVECGAASLAMVLAYYGRYIPLEQIRVDCGVSRDGSRADRIKSAAQLHGLECKGHRRDIDDLRESTLRPAILFWGFGHFVVFEGMKGDKFRINDPALGRRLIDAETFSKQFTGIVLEFAPKDDFKKMGRPTTLLSGFMEWVNGNWAAIFFAMACGILVAIPGLVIPGLTKAYIDFVIVQGRVDFSTVIVLIFIGAVIIQILLVTLKAYVLARLEVKIFLVRSIRMTEHMFRLPLMFFQQRFPGDLVSRFVSNQTIASNLGNGLTSGVISLLTAICYAVVLISFQPLIGGIAVVSTVLLLSALRITNSRVIDSNNSLQQEIGRQYGMLMSMMKNITEIKATSRENDVFSTWAGYQAKSTNSQQKLSGISTWLDSLPVLVSGILVNVIVLTLGGYWVMTGDLTLGGLIAMQMIANLLIAPVNRIVMLARTLQLTRADIARVNDVLNYKADAAMVGTNFTMNGTTAVEKLPGEIEFRNVTFGFDPASPPLISDLSFRIPSGTRMAITGGSGSGKSTIADLILGLHVPWSGEILVDGRNLQSIPQETLANSLTGVSESITIFAGTVRDNITLWDHSVSDEDIVDAMSDASCHELLARVGGLDAYVAESGRNFSGGQQQRMEIARALVRKPSFIILDQATSALDAETEFLIDDRIRARGCGALIISQRMNVFKDVDHILVLEKGSVVEQGTHESLLELGGQYSVIMEQNS